MRIITGSAKGTKLKAPSGLETRPTADRVKESVFNILSDIVVDARVLDIFAGTGNLGLEALSRGAKSAVFVDHSQESINIIKENAQHTKLVGFTEIYKNDVLRALDRLAQSEASFDLLFCDPPYKKGFVQAVLEKIDNQSIMADRGIVVIEHSRHEGITDEWENLRLKRTEKYGATLISFLLYEAKQGVI
ncbi:16S rRNA (guanine(966)-N(2))-methyltransferase RsmD [Pelosinus sp. sgz500959]|uniref:16S rRNA (guanine(966)-N(2))-methyltransferase RsmD n=1 Tax=Pelosinus sp. sgz500959 TaxID=3242472 RepID=UPI00366F4A97